MVVSGLPNITPIFSRIWLMKIRQVFDFETMPVSLRMACDISRACTPMKLSPISPSSSAFGTSAATESTTSTSIESGSDQRAGDLQRLLPVIGLRNQQIIDIDAQLARVNRIERVLDIDECRHAADLLRFGDHLQRDGRFARRFRAKDFADAAARKSTDSQRIIERNGAGGNRGTGTIASFAPRRRMEPLPNCFSIWPSVAPRARLRSFSSMKQRL